jgi:hypothetical protein
MMFTWKGPHPAIPLPDERLCEWCGPKWTEDFYEYRANAMALMEADPLHKGFEPEIWRLADDRLAKFRARFPVGVITELDLGGNRASKTERRAKRLVEKMRDIPGYKAWACQSTETASVQNQQSVIYKYLPREWKPETGKLRQGAITKTFIRRARFTGNVL